MYQRIEQAPLYQRLVAVGSVVAVRSEAAVGSYRHTGLTDCTDVMAMLVLVDVLWSGEEFTLFVWR